MTTIVLRVNSINSYVDLDGKLGKRIEFAEDVPLLRTPPTDEAKIFSNIMGQVQLMMPEMQQSVRRSNPKICLFLTEQDCDELNFPLEVNRTYNVEFTEGIIRFKS